MDTLRQESSAVGGEVFIPRVKGTIMINGKVKPRKHFADVLEKCCLGISKQYISQKDEWVLISQLGAVMASVMAA